MGWFPIFSVSQADQLEDRELATKMVINFCNFVIVFCKNFFLFFVK